MKQGTIHDMGITLLKVSIFLLSNLTFTNIYYIRKCIVIMKIFDFEILTYLYILRSPEFIYAIFGVMYVCMWVSLCVCVWVNTIESKRYIRLSSNLVCILQVTVGRFWYVSGVYLFIFYQSTKMKSYTLRLMESNSLKCSSI